MALEYFNSVWVNSHQSGGALLVLLSLGNYADEHGRSYPSISILAKRARLHERQVQRIIRKLVTDGEIEIERGGGQFLGRNCANNYRILLPPVVHKGGGKMSPPGGAHATPGVAPMPPYQKGKRSYKKGEASSPGGAQAHPSSLSRISQAALGAMIGKLRAQIREITNPVGRSYAVAPTDPAKKRSLEQLQKRLDALKAQEKQREDER